MNSASARSVAAAAIERISAGERSGSVLAAVLADSELDDRDRAFVTALTLGTVRMQRACNHVIAPHLRRSPDADVAALLRMGAFQLIFLGTPRHAAVGETVEVASKKVGGFVNAILRRVADDVQRGIIWPSDAVELSYPDWIVERFVTDWGDDGPAALAAMNEPEQAPSRSDGYIQGRASQWVVTEVGAQPGEHVVDLCAAPGGKSTGLAAAGAIVTAVELDEQRCKLLTDVVDRYGRDRIEVLCADGRDSGLLAGQADRVLVDAPCSGLGALGRRADARWRVRQGDVERLAILQGELMKAAAALVRPGGEVIYSVCTLTGEESTDVIEAFVADTGFKPLDLVKPDRWRPTRLGYGGIVLPHDYQTDGMAVFRLGRPE
ncbi:MAG: hypothetical protein GXP35_09870 [Actinobacteria bacterium]|nr:hypothetical protein [Actinomycetota bacterium]